MERVRTRFQGVYQREHSSRRHLGKPDVCYDITYKTPSGKKVWEKVGWVSENYTAGMAAQIRTERIKTLRHGDMPEITGRKRMITFAEAWAIYDKDWLYQVKSADEDRRQYKVSLEPVLGAMPLSSIGAHELEKLKSDLFGKGYSPQTVKIILGLVRRVYRKMIAWDLYVGTCPTAKVVMPKVDNARVRYLTEGEARKLLDAIRVRSRKWHDIALVSLHTGMRLGEILALRWEDINFDSGHLFVRDAKAGSRTVHLTRELTAMFEEKPPLPLGLVFPARGSGNVSQRASHTFIRAVEEIGVNKGITDTRQRVVFHTLRHTFASWLAIKGVPLYTIAELLGHKSIEMTKRYSHLCPDAKREAAPMLDSMVGASGAVPVKKKGKGR